jgi:hypothetical protein
MVNSRGDFERWRHELSALSPQRPPQHQHVPVMRDERDSEAFLCARELYLGALRRAGLE